MLSLNSLSIGYGTKVVVKGISLVLHRGQFVAIIGSNGAGKSTLFKTLVGIEAPLSGELAWDFEAEDENPFHKIGFSPQSQMIDWYTNAYDNVIQGSILAGIPLRQAHANAREALSILGIESLSDDMVDHLSGGQQQRIQIAREIARKPDVYILDEPTTGLDVETSEKLFSYLLERASQGALVIVSSHDLTLLDRYAQLCLFLDEGEAKYFGAIETFRSDGKSLRETYLELRSEK